MQQLFNWVKRLFKKKPKTVQQLAKVDGNLSHRSSGGYGRQYTRPTPHSNNNYRDRTNNGVDVDDFIDLLQGHHNNEASIDAVSQVDWSGPSSFDFGGGDGGGGGASGSWGSSDSSSDSGSSDSGGSDGGSSD